MFCSECGKPAHGKFCSHCGNPLTLEAGPGLHVAEVVDVVEAELVPQWDSEVHYESILKFPGVRETIERHARLATKKMTGEQFLALADKLIPLGVPMEGIAALVQPLSTKLGLKTGKSRTQEVPAPVGKVIVRVLASLAERGQTLRGVTQATDGCVFEAALPSDLFSFEGDLLITVHRDGSRAVVTAATHIHGQMFDWGKSQRCLDQLFQDLDREAA